MTKIRILVLFSLLLSFQQIFSAESATPEEDPTTTISHTLENQSNDLFLIPNLTQSIEIFLQGKNEDLIFRFQSLHKEQPPSMFAISVLHNERVQISQQYNFTQPEAFSIDLDYQSGQCSIAGDNGFQISHSIQDAEYDVLIIQKRITQPGPSSFLVWVEILVGLAGVITLGVVFLDRVKKQDKEKNMLPSKAFPHPAKFVTESSVCTTTAGVMMPTDLDEEVSRGPKESFASKKLTFSHGTLSLQTTCQSSSMMNSIPFVEENRYSEEDVSVELDENFNTVQISKSIQEEVEEENQRELTIEMDFAFTQGRRIPTVKEIQEMARRMEEDGLIGCDYSSNDSDSEGQYEAPALPNYFCCLVCLERTRCTIVEPCRHIFACEICVESLLDSGKACHLCFKVMERYELLETSKEIQDSE